MMARRLDAERGAAAVEFALVLPLLVLLLFGIFEFGRAYTTQISLTGAAREGARIMAIRNDASCNASPTGAKYAVVNAAALTPALACGNVSVTPSACVPGANVTVIATRAITYNIPLFGTNTWNVQGKAVMRCGG